MFKRTGLTLLIIAIFAIAAEPKGPTSTKVDQRLMSLVRAVGTAERQTAESDPLNLSALDYLSSVYEDSDYYTTGNCGKTGDLKNVDTSVYIHGLPQQLLSNFVIPVSGRITSAFGLRDAGNRMHKGVDIALNHGDSVCAAFDGKVARVGYERNGYGYFIIIEHADCVESRYAHLQRPLVKPGDEIAAGQEIALGGTSGNSTGPHLHFEIRCHRTPLDPTPLISRR